MYKIYIDAENCIFQGSEIELIEWTRNLVIENKDYDFSILGISDVEEYLDLYNDKLIIKKQ